MQSMNILTSNPPPPNNPPSHSPTNEPSGSGEFGKMLARDLANRKQQHDNNTKNSSPSVKPPDTGAKNPSSSTKITDAGEKSTPLNDKTADTGKKSPSLNDKSADTEKKSSDEIMTSLLMTENAPPKSLTQGASDLLVSLQSPSSQDTTDDALLTQNSAVSAGEVAAGLLQKAGQELPSRGANESINPVQIGNTPRHTPLQSLQNSMRPSIGMNRPETETSKAANLAGEEKFLPVAPSSDKAASSFAQVLTQESITSPSSNPSGSSSAFSSLNSISSATPNSPPSEQNLRLEPRVGTPAWDGALAQKVTWMSNQQMQVAQLHLNPPDLGPMEVTLTVGTGPDAETRIDFTSPHPAVRDAIQSALPHLREMMESSGISLGSTTVSAESFQQQSHSGRQNNSLNGSSENLSQISSEISSGSAMTRSHEGMVDTFA